MKTVFLRALEADDKAATLRAAIREPEAARGKQFFEVATGSFAAIPRSPFAYWVSERLRRLFTKLPHFEADGRTARGGMKTQADERFLRATWECRADSRHARAWVPLCKGGIFSPLYADIHLLVDWWKNGLRPRAAYEVRSAGESWGGFGRNEDFYFRPGLTWPRRTSGLSIRMMPEGCIFADKGPAAFVENDDSEALLALAAVTNSRAFALLVSLQLARTELAQSYEVGLIQSTPIPRLSSADQSTLANLAQRAWSLKRSLDTRTETSHAFTLPALLQVAGDTLTARSAAWAGHVRAIEVELSAIQTEIDARCFDLYGIDESDRRAVTDGFDGGADHTGEPLDSDADADDEPDDEDDVQSSADAAALAAELMSWAAGVAFGRFDLRLATGTRRLSDEPEPFDPLPICSPAMLTGVGGLPVANAPAGYPVAFPENGVLVDDLGHSRDLPTAVREVLDEVFKAAADAWWNEVGAVLDPKDHDLRTWLSSSFFEHHVKQYSKSRRKAPILWQLAVPSGRYSIWLYAHHLTRDSFFQIQNDVVTPKLAHEERQLTSLIQGAGTNPSVKERKEIAAQEAIVGELRSFLDEVKRVAPLWNPMLDDGVVLTMAPLWRLVPQHKAWQKELKSKWDELAARKYDWAHIALHLWPECVVPKCATDRSLAIAHGLEDAFWVEDLSGRWRQRISIADTVRYLEKTLYSDRLRQTVEELVAFSRAHPATGCDGPGWWTALSTGGHDAQPLALALWPERVLRRAVADPTRFTPLGIKPPRARSEAEFLAKLLNTHVPRLSEDELQALNEFCGKPGDHDAWRERWAEFAAGIHDYHALARAVHCARVVAKAQTDANLAEEQDLFRWFWLSRSCGPRHLKEPTEEIADAVRELTSFAVKAALKSLIEAPAADAGGGRGRARRAVTAAADGGTR